MENKDAPQIPSGHKWNWFMKNTGRRGLKGGKLRYDGSLPLAEPPKSAWGKAIMGIDAMVDTLTPYIPK